MVDSDLPATAGWEALGGCLAGSPSVVTWAPGHLDVYIRGCDNQLLHKWYAGGAWYAGWEPLGGTLTSDPAAVAWANGRIDVFAKGADNAVWQRYYDGGWGPWGSLGGAGNSSPAVASQGAGQLDLFVRGAGDNKLWQKSWNGTAWSEWASVVSGPAASATSPNVARGKPASQSSNLPHTCIPIAAKAVDGNTNSNFGGCSITSTNNNAQAWWQVDLKGSYTLDRIVLWNRTECCPERLSNFDVLVSPDGNAWTSVYYQPGAAGATTDIPLNQVAARHVKVQLRGSNYLSLAEVQVFGTGTPDPRLTDPWVVDIAVSADDDGDMAWHGCPGGYVPQDQDLNESAGGAYIYLCVKYGPKDQALQYIGVLDDNGDCWAGGGGRTWTKISVDLNRGAGGADLFYCYGRGSVWSIKDVKFDAFNRPPIEFPGVFDDVCGDWNTVEYNGKTENADLNKGAGGKYIYMCLKGPSYGMD